jgi:hypothetical protein
MHHQTYLRHLAELCEANTIANAQTITNVKQLAADVGVDLESLPL